MPGSWVSSSVLSRSSCQADGPEDRRVNLLRLSIWAWGYARRLPAQLLAVIILMGMSIVLNVLKPWPMVFLIDYVLKAQPMPPWLAEMVRYLPSHDQLGLVTWSAVATILLFLLEWACKL